MPFSVIMITSTVKHQHLHTRDTIRTLHIKKGVGRKFSYLRLQLHFQQVTQTGETPIDIKISHILHYKTIEKSKEITKTKKSSHPSNPNHSAVVVTKCKLLDSARLTLQLNKDLDNNTSKNSNCISSKYLKQHKYQILRNIKTKSILEL